MAQRALANPGTIEQAIAAVANSYKALRVRNGYRHNVKWVYRHLVEIDALGKTDTPAIFVIRPEGTTGQIQWYDERGYKQTLRLDVLGFIANTGGNIEDDRFATFAESLLSDMKKLAKADSQFGLGPAGVIKDSRLIADSNDAAWDSTNAIVGMGLELTVFFDGSNP